MEVVRPHIVPSESFQEFTDGALSDFNRERLPVNLRTVKSVKLISLITHVTRDGV